MRAPIAAVLFDLDGTLIDSAPDLGAAAEAMRAARGLQPLGLDAYRDHASSGARGMLAVAFDLTPDHAEFLPLRTEYLARYEQAMLERTHPFAGVPELLAHIAARGLRWGIVTNKIERFALPVVAGMPALAGAGAVVGGDTTAHAKPHPAPLIEAARRIDVACEQCVYVGDDERDIAAGRAAGMRTMAVTYGYHRGSGRPVETWGADHVVHSPLGIIDILETLGALVRAR